MKYIAFLRGIGPLNPNMRNEKLRGLFEDIGFKHVQTVIASGNVIFESEIKDIKNLENIIEDALPKKLGFSSTTIVRSRSQLEALLAKNLFKGMEDSPQSRLNVTFLKNPTPTSLKFPHIAEHGSYKVLGIVDDTVFTVIDLSGIKTPDVMAWLEKQFGKQITTRTWKTILRIMNKLV